MWEESKQQTNFLHNEFQKKHNALVKMKCDNDGLKFKIETMKRKNVMSSKNLTKVKRESISKKNFKQLVLKRIS